MHKNVNFKPDHVLVSEKYFKIDSEPNAAGLTPSEVDKIQQQIKAGEYTTFNKESDIQFEHRIKEQQKQQQKQVEANLAAMRSLIKWDFNKVRKLKKGPHYNTANGEEDAFKVF